MPLPDLNLLADAEPPPVRVLRPLGSSDFVLAADHAGRLIPRALGTLGLEASELTRHIAWDIGIAAVTETLSALLDASAVLQAYSRLVIDCNRAPGHPTSIPAISESTPEVGVLYHHETRLSRIMLELLRAEGDLAVGANEPYAITGDSDYTVPVHGEGRGIEHVEIEIRQDLITESNGQAAWARRMDRLLREADKRLRET
jgi:predicted N-formylglutamate amidohydrolase